MDQLRFRVKHWPVLFKSQAGAWVKPRGRTSGKMPRRLSQPVPNLLTRVNRVGRAVTRYKSLVNPFVP